MSPGQLVLCADDDADILALVRLRLEQAGFRVLSATDGDEALALVHERGPDIVVLDVTMPRRSGTEVLRTLRSNDATRYVPVVLLSARAHEDEVELGFAAGADAYLPKPFQAAELVELVRGLLEPPHAPIAA